MARKNRTHDGINGFSFAGILQTLEYILFETIFCLMERYIFSR